MLFDYIILLHYTYNNVDIIKRYILKQLSEPHFDTFPDCTLQFVTMVASVVVPWS